MTDQTAPEQDENSSAAGAGPFPDWQPISTAIKTETILVRHQGKMRRARWGKCSHLPWVGWCLADQGVESFDLITPQPTRWRPAPPAEQPEAPTQADLAGPIR